MGANPDAALSTETVALVGFLQRAFGYGLTGDVSKKAALVFWRELGNNERKPRFLRPSAHYSVSIHGRRIFVSAGIYRKEVACVNDRFTGSTVQRSLHAACCYRVPVHSEILLKSAVPTCECRADGKSVLRLERRGAS